MADFVPDTAFKQPDQCNKLFQCFQDLKMLLNGVYPAMIHLLIQLLIKWSLILLLFNNGGWGHKVIKKSQKIKRKQRIEMKIREKIKEE